MYNETVLPPKPRTVSADVRSAQSSEQLGAFDQDYQQENHHDDHDHDHEMSKLSNSSNNGEEDEGDEEEEEKRGVLYDIWSSILSNKKIEFGSGSDSPYVHPLVKRTASSLSEKSLEVCTESLGSETGSDGFGLADHSDSQKPELHDPISNFKPNVVEFETTKEYNNNRNDYYQSRFGYKRAPPTPAKTVTSSSSFPPPLPSLSRQMRSHRRGGRLVVEAVSVQTTTCLRAIRRDGRLVLTLAPDSGSSDDSVDEYPLRQGAHDIVSEDDPKELRIEFVMEEKASYRMIMSKVIGGEWRRPRKFNATVIKDLDDEEEKFPATEILSEIPALNAYEYYWRQLPSQMVVLGRIGNKISAQYQDQAHFEAQEEKVKIKVKVREEVVEKAAEYLVPFLRGCKEPKRSLLFWGPHCIATS